jgi:hypothetical protein
VDDGSGNWLLPVHVPLYTGFKGFLLGEVLVPRPEPTDSAGVLGFLDWLRPSNPKAAMFPGGFLRQLDPAGEGYQFHKGISLLSGTEESGEFLLVMDPESLVFAEPVELVGVWPNSNVPTLAKPAKMKLTSKTGVIKGSFLSTINGKVASTPYEGVLFADPLILPGGANPVRGGGFFSTDTVSGPVEMTSP